MARPRAVLAALALGPFALAGCGSERAATPATVGTAPRTPVPRAAPPAPEPRHVRRARCPASAANCEAATGEIVYLESKDPDGDGDLHLVVLGGDVTGPGFSVFDIEKELRPPRDPRVGDLASAAGPVYRGSYGQRQIQATVLYLAPRR